jgi:hypothetical protein
VTTWLYFIILTAVTGSPVGAAVILIIAWLVLDRFTLNVLPDPYRAVMRWRRIGALARTILNNPHDRRARGGRAGC